MATRNIKTRIGEYGAAFYRLPTRPGHFYQGCIVTACLVTAVIAGPATQIPFRSGIHNPFTTVIRQVIIAYAVVFPPHEFPLWIIPAQRLRSPSKN